MIKIILILLLSFFLENTLSLFISINNNFFNSFLVLTAFILISKIIEEKNKYYILIVITSIIYDVIFTCRIGLNLLSFLLTAIFIKNYNKYFKSYNQIIEYISIFIFYRIISYLILILVGYFSFDIFHLLKGIYSSIIVNLIYILILNKIFLYKRK